MIQIYGKEQCPYCDKEGMDYEYKQYGIDFDRSYMTEIFPGARTFPQIIVDGSKIGGYTELKELTDLEL
jgi:glutaredoxin 3